MGYICSTYGCYVNAPVPGPSDICPACAKKHSSSAVADAPKVPIKKKTSRKKKGDE